MAKNSIDRLFQQKLKNIEKNPNAEAWEKLSFLLNEQTEGKKHRKGVFMWISIAASLLLLLLTYGVWKYGDSNAVIADVDMKNEKQENITQKEKKQNNNLNENLKESKEDLKTKDNLLDKNVTDNNSFAENKEKLIDKIKTDKKNQIEKQQEKKEVPLKEEILPKLDVDNQVANQEKKQSEQKNEEKNIKVKVTVKLAKKTKEFEKSAELLAENEKPKKSKGKLAQRIQSIRRGEADASIFTLLGVDRDKLSVSLSKDKE